MFDAVSAGHLCVDLTPKFRSGCGGIKDIFVGGKLTNMDEMKITTGGSVSNTGIALCKLGLETPLIAKVGDDAIGKIITDALDADGGNSAHIKVSGDASSSYSVVLAPPGVDRIFLHNPGANDTFTSEDIDYELIKNARLLHFGYPTLMRKIFENGGGELEALLKKAKETGASTSLDMTLPDPSSPSGMADWEAILKKALPYTDIFMPSIEEIVYMLDRKGFERFKAADDDILKSIDIDYISALGAKILEMGTRIVVLKCGTLGYYVKTGSKEAIESMGRAKPADAAEWADKELFSGIFRVDDVKSATGAGDTSIAGFLASLLKGYTVERAITVACAVGAVCVTAYGATEAIIPLEEICAKIDAGWEKRSVEYGGCAFAYDESERLLVRR